MEIYFKLQRLIMSLAAGKSCAEGQVLELRRELEGLRDCPPRPTDGGVVPGRPLYADALAHRGVPPGAPPASSPPSRASSVTGDTRQEHTLQLRLTAPSSSPAKDIATLLKSTFVPGEIGVGPVSFRPTRFGLTIASKVKSYLDNLERAITTTPVTRSALEIRRPITRLPQLKISGVDSSIVPAMLLSHINSQNDMTISSENFHHRTVFTERHGTRAHIVEVSPQVFTSLRQKHRLHIGWTSCSLAENLYVPTCFKCSSPRSSDGSVRGQQCGLQQLCGRSRHLAVHAGRARELRMQRVS
ncbi:hypothetical protein HPB48_007452 [Haemaphysalis longicornis]|uniref:Uncharacterized protein n=1 Tax=Haemaphysalis longicornis TaxID=44386 RepID=A0A9J6GEK3_HAELO|nr:hypothetical protein HPB48_007452 [Haemaphysalis longicornis]